MKRWHFSINLLGFASACLMTASMFFPWWAFRWSFVEATNIYPYLVDGPASEFIGYHRSPVMILLTIVLIISIAMCAAGSLMKGRTGRILIGASGALVLLCCWRLLARVSGVAAGFGLPLIGHGWGGLGSFAKVEVWTWIQPGSYIIGVAGILALVSAVFHNQLRITNNS